MTVYTRAASLGAELNERVRGLGRYRVSVQELEGQYAFVLDGGPDEHWAVWVSGRHVVKLGAPEDGPVPPALHCRLVREYARIELLDTQIRELERDRAELVKEWEGPEAEKVRQLLQLRGIGINSAWLFVLEFFGWRRFSNRRQVGALAGLTPTPYQSGQQSRDQGISKAGQKLVRHLAVEIACSSCEMFVFTICRATGVEYEYRFDWITNTTGTCQTAARLSPSCVSPTENAPSPRKVIATLRSRL